MADSGNFFGFSTAMPELRPEELVLLDQSSGGLGEADAANLETFGDLDLDGVDQNNEDTFGDLGELEAYKPLQPPLPTLDADDVAAELEGVSLGVATALLKDDWEPTPSPALLAPSDLAVPVEELEAKLRAQAQPTPPFMPMSMPMPQTGPAPRPVGMAGYAAPAPYVSDYNNLMTRADKDFIIRVQMAQLQSANPHVDDFYYQAYTLKQERRQAGDDAGQLKMYVAKHTPQKENVYVPVTFENTLGKIAAQSLATPRPLIDFAGRREPTQTAGLSRRKVFKTIEAGYLLAIAVEDLDMEMLAVPADARGPLGARRQGLVGQLVGLLHLDGDDTLLRLLAIPKAQRLLARVAPLLPAQQLQPLVGFVLHHASALDAAIDDSESVHEELAAGLARAVAHASNPATAAANLATLLQSPDAKAAASSQVGRAVVGRLWQQLLAMYQHASATSLPALANDIRPLAQAQAAVYPPAADLLALIS